MYSIIGAKSKSVLFNMIPCVLFSPCQIRKVFDAKKYKYLLLQYNTQLCLFGMLKIATQVILVLQFLLKLK